MDIDRIDYHLEFYTAGVTLVEHYHIRVPFLAPGRGDRVHLHAGSLTLDVTRVVHEIVEHNDARLTHVVKIYGDEVTAVE